MNFHVGDIVRPVSIPEWWWTYHKDQPLSVVVEATERWCRIRPYQQEYSLYCGKYFQSGKKWGGREQIELVRSRKFRSVYDTRTKNRISARPI